MTSTKTTPDPDPATFDVEAWIAGATRPETVIVLSSKGREHGEHASLEIDLLAAQKAANIGDDRIVGGSSAEPARTAAQMDALAKVIEEGRHPFRLRGLSEADLKAMRVATKDLDEDDTTAHLIAACCISPALTAQRWADLRVALGEGQWSQLIRAANRVSFGDAPSVPFSLAASVALRTAGS